METQLPRWQDLWGISLTPCWRRWGGLPACHIQKHHAAYKCEVDTTKFNRLKFEPLHKFTWDLLKLLVASLSLLSYNYIKSKSEIGKIMDLEWILRLVLFGILHWVLAIMLLHDLSEREKVLGGRKWPWAIVIVFVTFLGSLAYLFCHPKLFYDSDNK